ncbi:MAG: phage tail protein, partial [Pseudomonadota bacterium]
MALGPYQFAALRGFSFQDISRQTDTKWAQLAVAQRMDAQHWTGPTSDQFTIKGVLFPGSLGGLDSLQGIRTAASVGVPLQLVSAGGEFFGLMAVHGVSDDGSYYDRRGLPHRDAYQITLQRY